LFPWTALFFDSFSKNFDFRMAGVKSCLVALLCSVAESAFNCADKSPECPQWKQNMGGDCKGAILYGTQFLCDAFLLTCMCL
jgi:hypothetical protein